MNKKRVNVKSRADFIQFAGIGQELAEFVTEFVEKPEVFYTISSEKRLEIESRMDAIILSFMDR